MDEVDPELPDVPLTGEHATLASAEIGPKGGRPLLVPHRCLRCGGPVHQLPDVMGCEACGAEWPVRDGVPFYSSADYFGEVSQPEMRALIDLALRTNWRTAVERTFRDRNREQHGYIADLNRASWIPILPIGPRSTVLDVGSGLGALTHALALNYERVVSVEPVAERVRFTRIRLEQEALANVDLLQTTIHALPFYDATFDLIVLNGILEWVAAWRHDGTPRHVQLELLRQVRRLLKPGGVVLIGIENRIGIHSFLGRVDHSGLAFTGVMPRWMASMYMKLRQPGFHRTLLDSSLGYRTYTYSPRGYTKLLRDAGFAEVDHWWPRDGYNVPHVMYRLGDVREVRDAARGECDSANQIFGYARRRVVKQQLLDRTGLLGATVPDLVTLARRPAGEAEHQDGHRSLVDVVNSVLAPMRVERGVHLEPCLPSVLTGHRLRNKSVVKFSTPSGPVGICKVANVRLPRADAIEHAHRLLQQLHARVGSAGAPLRGSIPAPVALLRHGPLVASVEAPAQGVSLGRISMAPGYLADRPRVTRHLELVAEWLTAARPALAGLARDADLAGIPFEWRTLGAAGARPTDADLVSWVQHGDFFPTNVMLDETARQLCVIDWDGCDDGYPPLFDWFCFVTGLYYTHRRVRRLPKGETIDRLSFRQTFFEQSAFATMVVALTRQMADALDLDRARIMGWFADYIAVRHHQFEDDRDAGSKARWGSLFKEFHAFFLTHQERCIFHPGRI